MPEGLEHSSNRPDAAEAARVAVFVLRATLDENTRERLNEFVLPPSSKRLDERAMIQDLVSREKPLRCSCLVRESVIVIRCDGVAVADQQNELSDHSRLHGLHDTLAGEQSQLAPDKVGVIVRAGNESLVTTLAVLNRFQQEYSIAHASAVEEPTALERRSGIAAVYTIWPSVRWVLQGPDVQIEGR